ncbi:hypothetical protein ADK67_37120 [Saccharothrix sp. NRRL B-16348]|uniref:AMP-binding protein n=1 Tax=Saccharothrix sp. NRRL B-16348 TaxID=1415542 RepID=UPI0006AF8585|nr:AMP-binding protein [Saccharothrix sp. NRRL B-16348]KOX18413.1 hypothetical protein ADK67_37120 [Saccharothrix sp. NRRL B-16348]
MAFVDRMLGHIANVLEVLADRPDTPVREVRMLVDAEMDQYRELDERSRHLAAVLRERGVRRGSRVAFMLEKDRALLVVVLAVLRSDEQVRADIPVLDPAQPHQVQPQSEIETEVGPLDAAYIMYTSGTTGRPKGVLVNQRAVIRLVRGVDYVDFSPATRILQTLRCSTLRRWARRSSPTG